MPTDRRKSPDSGTYIAKDGRFEFDRNAKAAFASARFKPAMQDGIPIAVKLGVEYIYEIHFREPVVKESVEADYPEAALRLGITDSILAELDVNAEGVVTAVRITQPATHPEYRFEAAVLSALEKLRFEPAAKNGVPVPATVAYRYDFVLPEGWVPLDEQPVKLVITFLERGTRGPITSGFISLKRGEDPPLEETFEGGVYRARGLLPGLYEVLIEADGYAPIETRETIVAGKVVEATYLIERESYDMLDMSDASETGGDYVYETRRSRLDKEVEVKTLTVSEIQRVPGNNGDAVKVVQNLPGVSRSTFNSGTVIIRGSGPSDSAVFLDGTPIPMIYHFGGLASTVNSDSIGAIDFFPGNFSVKYGRAMGGIIDVRTRPPNRQRYTGYLDLDTMDGSLVLEGPVVRNSSFFASVRRSWFDSILKAILDDDDLDMTAAPRYWDYQARLNWWSGKPHNGKSGHALELMIYGSDDLMKLLGDFDVFEINTAFHHAKLTFGIDADSLDNRLIYDFGWNHYLFRRDRQKDEKVAFSHAIRDDLTLHIADRLDLMIGIDVLIQQYRVDVFASDRGAESLLNGEMPDSSGYLGGRDSGDLEGEEADFTQQKEQDNRFLPALYLALGVRPIDRLHLSVGGRFDYDSLSNEWSVDTRGTGRFSVLKYLALKGGVGTFHQPPEEKALSRQFGNPELGMQNAIHFSFGAEALLPMYDALSLDVTGFYKILSDLVIPSDRQVERDGRVVRENYAGNGEGRIWGVEVMLRHRLFNNFFGWISYTLSRSERRDGKDEPWHLFRYDQTHVLTLLGSYRLPRGFQVGLRFRYVTGTPYTPLSTGVFDSDVENFEPVTHKPYSARTEAYHQLDLRIDKAWVFDYWVFTTYLDVQNVYFHANEELSHYSYDYAEREPIRGLPIQPSFGIRGAF